MNYNKIPGKEIKVVGELVKDCKPIISIITPFYNGGSTLEQTANSIFSQTFPFFEWVIIDDGSKDKESLDNLKSIEKKDKRVKVFHKENGGPSQARDYGIAHVSSSSKYICFLDCDDIIGNTMLEVMYWSLETHTSASFVYPSIINFGDYEYYWEPYFSLEEEIVNNVMCINTMVKKEALLDVGCFGIKEKAMFEDWNLWLKLLSKGYKPIRINAPLFWYRTSSTGELSRAKKNSDKAMKLINSTVKTIKEDVEAIQFPRMDSRVEASDISDMILPKYDLSKSVLFLLPNSLINKNRLFDYEIIKRFFNDGYNCFTVSTEPIRNDLRQEIEDYSDYYDLSSFIDYGDYVTFINYLIESRGIDTMYVTDGSINWSLVPLIKSKTPDLKIISPDYNYSLSFVKGSLDINMNVDVFKEKYGIPKDKRIISFIERISYDENPLLFVEIASKLFSKYPDLFFVFSGRGPMVDEVKESVNRKNMSTSTLFIEQIDDDDLYYISDIVVSCPRHDGVSINFYKAIMNGVPVVINNSCGQGDSIYDCGIVVDEFDNSDLYVIAVSKILDDYESYKKAVYINSNKLILTLDSYYKALKKDRGLTDNIIFEKIYSNYVLTDVHSLINSMSTDYYSRYHGLYFKAHSKKLEKIIKKARTFGIKYYCQNEMQFIFRYISRFKKILIGIKEFFTCIFYILPVLYKFLKIIYRVVVRKLCYIKRRIFR